MVAASLFVVVVAFFGIVERELGLNEVMMFMLVMVMMNDGEVVLGLLEDVKLVLGFGLFVVVIFLGSL